MNLAKFRKAQHELQDASERAEAAEVQLIKQRAFNRAGAQGREASPDRAVRAASMVRASSVRR